MWAKTIICRFHCGEFDFTEVDKAEKDGWKVDNIKYVPGDGYGTLSVRMLKEGNDV